jgi:hypothetical protein
MEGRMREKITYPVADKSLFFDNTLIDISHRCQGARAKKGYVDGNADDP